MSAIDVESAKPSRYMVDKRVLMAQVSPPWLCWGKVNSLRVNFSYDVVASSWNESLL